MSTVAVVSLRFSATAAALQSATLVMRLLLVQVPDARSMTALPMTLQFVAPAPSHEDWPATLVSWCLPPGHVTQALCPSAPLYLPPGQSAHAFWSEAAW